MGIASEFKKVRFEDRTIEGIGGVRVKHLKASEMLKISDGDDDDNTSLLKIVAASIYEGEAGAERPAFSSAEEAGEIDWEVIKPLGDAAMEVNKFDRKAAEKNLSAPPSDA
jgi:hypothetical protein